MRSQYALRFWFALALQLPHLQHIALRPFFWAGRQFCKTKDVLLQPHWYQVNDPRTRNVCLKMNEKRLLDVMERIKFWKRSTCDDVTDVFHLEIAWLVLPKFTNLSLRVLPTRGHIPFKDNSCRNAPQFLIRFKEKTKSILNGSHLVSFAFFDRKEKMIWHLNYF